MDEQDKVWETIYGTARQVASRSNRIHRGLVTTDDVYQHLSLWALEHWHKIEEWEQQESLKYKLRRTFYNEAQKYVARERMHHSRTPMSDSFYYTHEVLHELLRDVWTHEGWTDTADLSNEFVSKSSKPAEGGNRMALLSDVAAGLKRLNDADQALLRLRYANGGMEFDALAEEYKATEEAIRKRVKRALTKLQDRLGGEAPVWYGRRRNRTNAEAREEVKNND
jgi:RNA polymerase sigma factor (sigma-70 family)